MSGYLDNYGAGEERRNKIIKRTVLGLAAALILGTVLYFGLRHHGERKTLDAMMERLKAKDYAGAYALWGCTAEKPCRAYSMEKFLEDWGPKSPAADLSQVKVTRTLSCTGGLYRTYEIKPGLEVALLVSKLDGAVGFAPAPGRLECTFLP